MFQQVHKFVSTESTNNENRLYISLKITKNLVIAYDSNITPVTPNTQLECFILF